MACLPSGKTDRLEIVGQARGGHPLREFVVTSDLAAAPEAVWRHAVSPAGVNAEFRPLLRMTFPEGVTDLTASGPSRDRLFRSWLLLGGVVPVEYDDVVFAEVEPGHRFLERSSLLTQRVWEHERSVEAISQGCRLTDRIAFAPRVPGIGPLFGAVFRALFRWRHRNLRKIFGEPPAQRDASAR